MKNKKVWIGAIALLLVVALAATVYAVWGPKGVAGGKTITVQVVQEDQSTQEHKITTDAEFLRGALDEGAFVEGDETEYGLFIKTVDGVTADEAKQQWWCITKGGETVTTGVETTPIADGDVFELTMMTGW